ncbi:MAG: hypothetical protein LBJ48_02060 [Coriobacteriales bacterium]|jgi:hypothetical protein|nr:hypothetical protein [Coriobacteriales bacterium]
MRNPDVIIPPNHPNPPDSHEIEAAWILARHFGTVVEFLIPTNGYKTKTADFVIDGLIWEMKSPTGKSKNTVGFAFKRGSKQARCIVLDARRIGLREHEALKYVQREYERRRKIRRVLFITKSLQVLDLQR